MPFKSREALGGAVDPNINQNGRPQRKTTNRSVREKELLQLLRKIKPHVAESIKTAVDIMGDREASDQNKLKAAVIILDNYKQMVTQLYSEKYDEDDAEAPQENNAAVLSLTVVNTEKDE